MGWETSLAKYQKKGNSIEFDKFKRGKALLEIGFDLFELSG